jgi:hypothetical protein
VFSPAHYAPTLHLAALVEWVTSTQTFPGALSTAPKPHLLILSNSSAVLVLPLATHALILPPLAPNVTLPCTYSIKTTVVLPLAPKNTLKSIQPLNTALNANFHAKHAFLHLTTAPHASRVTFSTTHALLTVHPNTTNKPPQTLTTFANNAKTIVLNARTKQYASPANLLSGLTLVKNSVLPNAPKERMS